MAVGEVITAGMQKGAELAAFVQDPETERVAKALVQESVMAYTVVKRGGIDEAIRFLSENLAPKVLLIDISNVSLALSEVDRLVSACEPTVIIIAIGERNDIALFRGLVQHGVADYLIKPVTSELLQRTISFCTNDPSGNKPKTRTGKVIAVTGARGGAGVTTIGTSLGWLLANQIGRRVAMVDADTQYSSMNLMLGLPKSNGLIEALRNAHRIDNLFLDRTLQQHGPKLFVLNTEEDLGADAEVDPDAMMQVLSALEHRFHYVILDLPRRPDGVFRRLLEYSHVRVIVADPTIVAARDVIRLRHLLGRDEIGRRALVVINHTTPNVEGEISLGDFETATGRKVDYVVPYSRDAIHADNSGQIFASIKGQSSSALAKMASDLSGSAGSETGGLPSRLVQPFKRALSRK